jgi:hypothetical protein
VCVCVYVCVCVCVCVQEREGGREGGRQGGRQRERVVIAIGAVCCPHHAHAHSPRHPNEDNRKRDVWD